MTTSGDMNASPAPVRTAGARVRSGLALFAGTFVALLALPVCILFGAPLAGWAVGAACVLGNRLVEVVLARLVRDSSITMQLGVLGFSMLGRAGIIGLTMFFTGAAVGASGDRMIGFDRPDLARVAIVVFLLGFTIDTGIELLRRSAARETGDEPAGTSGIAATHQETPA
jgi:hypothetical protein